MMKTHRLATTVGAIAACVLAPITSAFAAAPETLPAPEVLYYNTGHLEGTDHQEGLWARGAGCIDTAGTPGVVTASITTAAGTVLTSSVTADSNGSWSVNLQSDQTAAGMAKLNATCDVYNTTVVYPVAAVNVPATPQVLNVALTADESTLVISGTGCINPAGVVGDVVYDAVLPGSDPAESTIHANRDGSWSVSYPAAIGNYEFVAACRINNAVVEYDPEMFEIYDTVNGPSTNRAGGSTGAPQAKPQLAATGSHTPALGAGAAALITAGLVLAYAGRRRTV